MSKSLIGLAFLALFVAAGCERQRAVTNSASVVAGARTHSSFDGPTPGEKPALAGMIKFQEADLAQVLATYGEISGRSVIRGGNLPDAKFTFSNQTPMTTVEVLQALDTVLAAQGIATVFLGSQYVKAVPADEAITEAGPVVELPPDQLPDSSSFLIYIVKLKHVSPSQAAPALAPFPKLPNSIIAIGSGRDNRPSSKAGLPNLPSIFPPKDHGILVLRDYSSNVRRMLQVLEKLEEQ